MRVIIVERERVHQKSTFDALTQGLVYDSARQIGGEVSIVPAEIDALELAVRSAEPPAVVISFARDAAFLSEMESRHGASTDTRIINSPRCALFATRHRFLCATAAVSAARLPRWIKSPADQVPASSRASQLTYPLWVHHPVYNSCSTHELGVRVSTRADLEELCFQLGDDDILLQEEVEGELQKVYFLNGRVVSDLRVSEQQVAVVSEIAARSKSTFFGIDYVMNGASAWVLEMNDWPSFRGHERTLAVALKEVLASV